MKRDPYAALRATSTGAPTHWRSLEHRDGDPSVTGQIDLEFPNGTEGPSGLSRRQALKLSGASIALGMLAGCEKIPVRRPLDNLVPFVKQPENYVPGVRVRYASAVQRGAGALGVLVTTFDGRPTKLEGNPKHPSSLGSSDTWLQAEVLKLYDPDRARAPLKAGQVTTWDAWDTAARELGAKLAETKGKGLAVLTEVAVGPTFERLLGELATRFPEAKTHRFDRLAPVEAIAGAALAFGPGARAHVDLTGVKAIFAAESDFLFSGPEHLRHARAFGQARAVQSGADVAKMKRLYVAESMFSGTGTNADHRLRWASGQQLALLEALGRTLVEKHGVVVPSELGERLLKAEVPADAAKFIGGLAKDLAAERGTGIILVGETQPAAVHALALALNAGLGALESGALKISTGAPAPAAGLEALATALNAGEVETLLVLEGNPAYTAPGALNFGEALKKAKTVIHVGVLPEETGMQAAWHLPAAHFLEAWGDAEAWNGQTSVVQPAILPLHGGRAAISVLAQVIGLAESGDKALVDATWRAKGGAMETDKAWRRALHDGLFGAERPLAASPAVDGAGIATALGSVAASTPSAEAIEVVALYGHLRDGRLANVAWSQELPDSTSKLCWDNAVLMAPSLAQKLGIKSAVTRNDYTADLVELSVGGRKIVAPTFVLPGMAPFTVAINAGYGKSFGDVAKDVGVNVYPLLASGHAVTGVAVKRTGGTATLCSTQDHFSVPGNPLKELTFAEMSAAAKDSADRKLGLSTRPLFRSADADEYAKDGGKAARKGDLPRNLMEHGETPKNKPSRPIQPTNAITYEGQQWGMVIDLSSCIGCNACAIACVAENNIAVVGREQVMLGREMHWIRIDRYFSGDVDQPTALHQPVACMHCENAPCEPVCPVSATVHDEEGMNSMAYNRCIGTRYCANNCPYKVRRFNYLDYTHTGNYYVEPKWVERMKTQKLQRNPNVSVRYRGVMEKCTYCTQRVEEAKIAAKREGRNRKELPDGAVTPACAEACPTQAITFGNVNDPKSRVFALKQSDRNYEMLQDLNVRPRTTYLARIRNENEELT